MADILKDSQAGADAASQHCAQCLKQRGPNAPKLFQCSGCKAVYYCGEQCQKLAWKSHKLPCKRAQTTDADRDQCLVRLREYAVSHRTTLVGIGRQALRLFDNANTNINNARRRFMEVSLRPPPGGAPGFRATNACVTEYSSLPSEKELEMRAVMRRSWPMHEAQDFVGTFCVKLVCEHCAAEHVVPYGVPDHWMQNVYPWRETLLMELNERLGS